MNARRDRPLTVEPMLPSGGAVHRIIGRKATLAGQEPKGVLRLLGGIKRVSEANC